MPTRYWQLPGGIVAKEELAAPVGRNFFWFCHRCGEIFARAWVHPEEDAHWCAISALCPGHEGDKWNVPGDLTSVAILLWNVPLEVARYQVEVELAFTHSPNHPYNEKDQSCS